MANNYLLRGEREKLEETLKRVWDYHEADYYNLYARIYHRLGNQEESERYQVLAKDNGDWNKRTERFLELSF